MTTRRSLLAAGATLLAAPALPRGAAAQVDTSRPVGTLRFVSGPTGGAYFPLGEGTARAINAHTRGARAASTPTGGSTENVRLISLGEADFGWAAADVVYFAYNGGREFRAPLRNIRAVTAGHSSAGHMAVRAESPIRDIADLKGKSIAVGAAGSSNAQTAIEWLKTYGVEQSEVQLRYISTGATVDALRDGTIDAGFQLSGLPSGTWLGLANDHPLRFLGIAPDKMAALNARLPFYVPEVIKGGTYRGTDQDVTTIGVKVVLVTRDTVPDIQAHEMARVLIEHNADIARAHPTGVAWDGRGVADAGFIPFHPGAAAYYTAKGIKMQAG